LPTLFERELDAHQTMFAMGEAIAHLNRLEQAGRVTRSEDRHGRIRFVVSDRLPVAEGDPGGANDWPRGGSRSATDRLA
jgi:hypothetical protein